MPLNQTKIDIILILTELMYYCPLSLVDIIAQAKYGIDIYKDSNKELLRRLRAILESYKNYPSKKGK